MARILVIEDDSSIRSLLKETFARAGYEVSTAANGADGMLSFRANHPDLVITDLLMPEREGLETIHELHFLDPVAKIVAISGAPSEWCVLETAEKLGASAALSKPFKMENLLDTVARLLKV